MPGRLLRRRVLADPVLFVALVALALVIASHLAGGTSYQTFIDNYEGIFLRILVVVAVLYRLDRIHDSYERAFWKRIAAAFVVWLCADALPSEGANTGTDILAKVIDDAFYVMFYVVVLSAVELRPHLHEWNRRDSHNRMTIVASGLFVLALFVYCIVVPSYRNPPAYDSFVPSFYLFVALDIMVGARFLYMAVAAHERRWRVCYGLLSGTLAFWLFSDLWSALYYAGLAPPIGETTFDLATTLPYFVVITAVAYRGYWSKAKAGHLGGRFLSWVHGSPKLLLTYGVGLLAAHVLLYAVGVLDEESEPARSVVAIAAALGMCTLALIQYRGRGQRGNVAEITVQVTDEQLKQSQKMEALGHLAGGVAHDFNNLLTVIRGYTEMILDSDAVATTERDYAEQINVAARRASALTMQLLAFSRKQVFNSVLLDVNGVIAETREMLQRLIGEDIQLITNTGEGVGRVHADPGQITQVLFNLAANARSAMPAGGQLTVETRIVDIGDSSTTNGFLVEAGRYVLMSVADTGRGMDAITQSRIFEPFFTADEEGRGTGLGLATVYGIIRQSAGFIDVDSEPGVGTTFHIFLPMVARDVTARPELVQGPSVVRGTETILVVEDEDLVRGMTVEYLVSRGYRVLEASNGRQALDVISDGDDISLLLTDLVMPEIGGRRLAGEVERLRPGIKIVYMSGYADEETLSWLKAEPGAHFLAKPFPLETLGRKVREALDARGLYDAT